MSKHYEHWKLHTDQQHILWLTIDRQNSSVNSLNQAVLAELDQIIDEIAHDNYVAGMILKSGKKSGFVAGADISQFLELKTAEEAFELLRQGQLVFNKLAALSIPTVAMIEGFCLGGGLELALACRYRVAENSPRTKIGLPEVLLGIHPGWGGTQRLPELIGSLTALPMICRGEIVSARKAAKLGIVDAAVPKRVLEQAAIDYVTKKPAVHQPVWWQRLVNHDWIRPLVGKYMYNQLTSKVNPQHYPAPFAVIKNWERYGTKGEEAMLQEARSIGELMVHPTGRNLVRLFFLRERLKGLAKGIDQPLTHVHVIGAGTMGGDIAAWCALSGFKVTLQDRAAQLLTPAIKRANQLFDKKLETEHERIKARDRLIPDIQGLGVAYADVVIEAIYEDLEAKQKLYTSLEPRMKKGALLATNTSSLPLAELNKVLEDPDRLVGIHFFNPVSRMELVEVVKDDSTHQKVVNQAIAFVKKINRLPLPVKSTPGFLVNRVLMPYLLESMELLEEGLAPEHIDRAATDFGMRMGPIELADRVGLDICLSVAEILTAHLGGKVPEKLRDYVKQGYLGVKTGRGIYTYRNGQPLKTKITDQKPPSDLIDRMILRMLNEAVACLREGVVADKDLLDAGMIFGTGFAPFTGGPMHYAESRGISNIVGTLEEFSQKYGERFQPDQGWKTFQPAENKENFVRPPMKTKSEAETDSMVE